MWALVTGLSIILKSDAIKAESVADPTESSEMGVWVLMRFLMELHISGDSSHDMIWKLPRVSLYSRLGDARTHATVGRLGVIRNSPSYWWLAHFFRRCFNGLFNRFLSEQMLGL
ncbi:hypothetical protein L1987_01879 [Smallanthus sonchifolius]|uniref:Uncharacterized protein n=1 Tax=Smallanthus sonchifolius TaxID=185202 RepID=A0ACB9K6H4_9ASTR|nr:hypothetical protein L1987_01879 [Smallanthus sonchifolius]